jgi:hypothetical protein
MYGIELCPESPSVRYGKAADRPRYAIDGHRRSVFDGSRKLSTNLHLSGGKASSPIASLSVGTHSLMATYGGDRKNIGGTSAVLTQTVTTH